MFGLLFVLCRLPRVICLRRWPLALQELEVLTVCHRLQGRIHALERPIGSKIRVPPRQTSSEAEEAQHPSRRV